MADRDSVLEGNQIKDATITEDELNTSVGGDGIEGGGGAPLAVTPDVTTAEAGSANAVLVGANGVRVDIDDSTLEGSGQGASGAEQLRVKALGISNSELANDTILEVKLDATNAPTDGFLLSFDNASGGFTWVESPATGSVQEGDFQYDDFTATLDGILTDFDLTDIPVTKSLKVYINGQIIREGSGKGYELNPDSGDTKTIRILGDLLDTPQKLEAYYVIDN